MKETSYLHSLHAIEFIIYYSMMQSNKIQFILFCVCFALTIENLNSVKVNF